MTPALAAARAGLSRGLLGKVVNISGQIAFTVAITLLAGAFLFTGLALGSRPLVAASGHVRRPVRVGGRRAGAGAGGAAADGAP